MHGDPQPSRLVGACPGTGHRGMRCTVTVGRRFWHLWPLALLSAEKILIPIILLGATTVAQSMASGAARVQRTTPCPPNSNFVSITLKVSLLRPTFGTQNWWVSPVAGRLMRVAVVRQSSAEESPNHVNCSI